MVQLISFFLLLLTVATGVLIYVVRLSEFLHAAGF